MGARRPELIGFVGVRDHFVDVRWTGAVANLIHCVILDVILTGSSCRRQCVNAKSSLT